MQISICDECGEEFDDDELINELCPNCYDAEELTCESCGEKFARDDSPSEKTCPSCLSSRLDQL